MAITPVSTHFTTPDNQTSAELKTVIDAWLAGLTIANIYSLQVVHVKGMHA